VKETSQRIQRTYLVLTLLTTLAASFIWGVNTLFFSLGQVVFEVPTGVVADTRGRRFSFLLGAATLLASTLLYLVMWQIHAPFAGWAVSSILLGLGFTFFSGATEAWLVDALKATGFKGELESVFGRAQVVGGVAMLTGSVAGGVITQLGDLGTPYVVRVVLLGVTLAFAWWAMHDLGFTPQRDLTPGVAVRNVLNGAVNGGLRNPPVRWLMLSAPFIGGVGIYAFYAFQPYLLELYGDPNAYSIAGLAAALLAGAQILGGLFVRRVRLLFARRTDALLVGGILSVVLLAAVGIFPNFIVAVVALGAWALLSAFQMPIRQAFINGAIRSEERATVLSFDSLMSAAGGVVAQPILGRTADVYGYPASYVVAAGIRALALPFVFLARREKAPSDYIVTGVDQRQGGSGKGAVESGS
jgi:MFS family permease